MALTWYNWAHNCAMAGSVSGIHRSVPKAEPSACVLEGIQFTEGVDVLFIHLKPAHGMDWHRRGAKLVPITSSHLGCRLMTILRLPSVEFHLLCVFSWIFQGLRQLSSGLEFVSALSRTPVPTCKWN